MGALERHLFRVSIDRAIRSIEVDEYYAYTCSAVQHHLGDYYLAEYKAFTGIIPQRGHHPFGSLDSEFIRLPVEERQEIRLIMLELFREYILGGR